VDIQLSFLSLFVLVAGCFAPLTFGRLDVSPLHWTFRPLEAGRFAHSLLTMTTHVSSVCRAGFFPATSVAVSSPISDDRGDTCLSPGLH